LIASSFPVVLHDVDHGTKNTHFPIESNSYHDHVFCMLQIYASNRQSARSWKLTHFDENKFSGICDHRSCSRVDAIAKIDPGFLEDDLRTTYAILIRNYKGRGTVDEVAIFLQS